MENRKARRRIQKIAAAFSALCLLAAGMPISVFAEDEQPTPNTDTLPAEEEEINEPEPEDNNSTADDADDEQLVTIIQQPENAYVNYPEGAVYHVEVDHPELVESYQWEYSDGVNVYRLNGTSATTDTLILPSTEYIFIPHYFCCIITDINGNKIYTVDAELNVMNPYEEKPVLYFGDYAIEPGESLDLAEKGYGQGTVSYDDATNITFNNVSFTNSGQSVFDDYLERATGMLLEARRVYYPEYYIHLIGENTIENTFFDRIFESGGATLNSHFGTVDDPNKPTLVIDGEGTLKIIGGQRAINTDGNLEIAADIEIEPYYEEYRTDGIWGYSIYFGENTTVDMKTNGLGVDANGDVYFEDGAELNIDMTPPHISSGPTSCAGLRVSGNVDAKGAVVNITGTATPENFVPYGRYLSGFHGFNIEGAMYLDGTEMNIDLGHIEDETEYAANFNGIRGGEDASVEMSNGAAVHVVLRDGQVVDCAGVTVGGSFEMSDDCVFTADIESKRTAYGIKAEKSIAIKNADVMIELKANERDYPGNVITETGMESKLIDIDLSDCRHVIEVSVSTGEAILGDMSDTVNSSKNSGEYIPEHILLSDETEILWPEGAFIDRYDYTGPVTLPKETIYSDSDTEQPTKRLVLGGSHAWGEPEYIWSEDNSEVTASRVCANDEEHIEAETVKTTSEVTKEATGTEDGTMTFTAEFTNPVFDTQFKDVPIPAAGEKDDPAPAPKPDDTNKDSKGSSPRTSDSSSFPMWMMLLMGSLMIAGGSITVRICKS